MNPLSSIDDIARLYAARGDAHYGEDVTQIEHALQCAALAQAAGSPPSLIVAALLHDIGHLFENEADAIGSEKDFRHQVVGARALLPLFPAAVCEPIALHVDAKRYLCRKEPDYQAGLSAASKISLALQGGSFDAAQARVFESNPHARDAISLRRFDDTGKSGELVALTFSDFMPLIRRVAYAA